MALDDKLKKSATEKLNRHGYAFHHAVMKAQGVAFDEGHSKFLFYAEEFPVSGDVATRIDIVCRHRDRPIYLLGECKRVNPAYASWLLVKSKFVRRDYDPTELSFDKVYLVPHMDTKLARAGRSQLTGYGDRLFNLAIPFKSGEKGNDSGGSDRDGVEEAASQVYRGVSGFMNLLSRRHELCSGDPPTATIIPVIYTTAKLYITDVDLSEADLLSGKIEDRADLVETNWAWLRYHVSPSLRPESLVIPDDKMIKTAGVDVARLLDLEYARSVAIVNAAGISDFLRDISNT